MPADTLRHTHFPYCLKRLENGRYVVLNRNYKPLGFMTGDWVVYEDQPVGVKIKGLTAKTAAKLSHKGSEDLDMIMLYQDSNGPHRGSAELASYFKRLETLMNLKIES